MHDVGLPVKVAQERLRHKKSSTTLDIYTKASKRGHKEAAEAIAKRIRPPREAGTDAVNVKGQVARGDGLTG
jgi:hypothetical protein